MHKMLCFPYFQTGDRYWLIQVWCGWAQLASIIFYIGFKVSYHKIIIVAYPTVFNFNHLILVWILTFVAWSIQKKWSILPHWTVSNLAQPRKNQTVEHIFKFLCTVLIRPSTQALQYSMYSRVIFYYFTHFLSNVQFQNLVTQLNRCFFHVAYCM